MPQIVMCYPSGKVKALTMSYDDGRAADRRLVELFNKHGIKGTFHLNSGLMGNGDRIPRDEIASLYRGHEVSSHTVTHPSLAKIPREKAVSEIMEDRIGLEQLTGYTVRGFSYPFGSFNKEVKELLPHLGIEYARVVESSGGFSLPDDWLEWRPTCHHNHDLMSYAERFVKKAYQLLYVWGHSYEFDNDQNWELMESFCSFIGGREEIWYATNIEIADYMKAFRQLRFSADCSFVYNPSAASVWLLVDKKSVEVKGGARLHFS
jgi:peptidoglycan/xylan/chitin deacetylase (PgdA/CDA1 family)